MKRVCSFCAIVLFVTICGVFAEEDDGEKAVTLKDLTPAVQKSVQDFIAGAELKGLSMEEENGATVYEVETIKNGKTRDAMIDASGAIMEVEESVAIDNIPGPAKKSIKKAAAGGKITKLESVTQNGFTNYEAVIIKGNKRSEIKVTAEGLIIE